MHRVTKRYLKKKWPGDHRMHELIDYIDPSYYWLYSEYLNGDSVEGELKWKRNIIDPDIRMVIALGHGHELYGNLSTILGGYGSITRSYRETLIGSYPEDLSGTSDSWVNTDRLLAIGNGLDTENRNDALRIYKSGYTVLDNSLRIGDFSWGANNPGDGSLRYTAENRFEGWFNEQWNPLLNEETDPVFSAHISSGITLTDLSNWNTAYGWGNHADAGYLTSYNETDPVFSAHAASGITSTNISNWNSAYGWGNHADAGYLTSFTETDPVFSAHAASGITSTNISNWNAAYGWGNHADVGYLTSYSETDPVFMAHTSYNISNGSGFLKNDGAGNWSYDNSSYITDAPSDGNNYGRKNGSWEAIPGCKWTADTNGINYNFGNVGIGTNSDSGKGLKVLVGTSTWSGSFESKGDNAVGLLVSAEYGTGSIYQPLLRLYATGNRHEFYKNGQVRFYNYGDGSFTGTATRWAAFDTDGYIIEVDPPATSYPSAGIAVSTGTGWGTSITNNSANWNSAYSWGNHAEAGYLTSFTETDPVFSAHPVSDLTVTDLSNWNTAFGWGDHSAAGYLTSIPTLSQVLTAGNSTNNKTLLFDYDGGVAAEFKFGTKSFQFGEVFNSSDLSVSCGTYGSSMTEMFKWRWDGNTQINKLVIGYSSTTEAGAIRYSSGSFQGYNGSAWIDFGGMTYWQSGTGYISPLTITDEVRIGSTSALSTPATKLQVSGNVHLSSAYIYLGQSVNTNGYPFFAFIQSSNNIGLYRNILETSYYTTVIELYKDRSDVSIEGGLRIGTTTNETAGNIRYNSGSFQGYNGSTWIDFGGGSGASTFLGLTDTPGSYSGQAGKFLKVNAGATGVEFTDAPAGGGVTSVGIISDDLIVSGSPVTTNGNISLQIANGAVQSYMLHNNIISGRTALTSGLASTDELLVSDAGTVKRMDVSVLQSYMQDNLSFSTGSSLWSEGSGFIYRNSNVSVASSSNYSSLHVGGGVSISTDTWMGFNSYYDTDWKFIGTGYGSIIKQESDYLSIYLAQGSGTAGNSQTHKYVKFEHSTGDVLAHNFRLNSARQLKENIQELENIQKFDRINIIQFNFKDDKDKNLRYGVIAEDIEKVTPELVYGLGKDKTVAYIDLLLGKIARLEQKIYSIENKIQ